MQGESHSMEIGVELFVMDISTPTAETRQISMVGLKG